jgi:glutathione synthase/RimK-type ligase-like ATP-grasp enzyme
VLTSPAPYEPSCRPLMPVIANSQRVLSRAIHAAAAARGATVETLGQGWIHRISLGQRVRFIWGYAFDINPAATHLLVGDKAATSDVLAAAGVANVHHRLFLHPDMAGYVAHHPGNWVQMHAFAVEHGWDVVVKDNAGTGGRGVYRVRSPVQLEDAAHTLFQRVAGVALSPFVEAHAEVRVIMLDGRCLLALRKVRPSVEGDGVSTVLQILAAHATHAGKTLSNPAGTPSPHENKPVTGLGGLDGLKGLDCLSASTLAHVPAAGTHFLLNWRHNLGQGAAPVLLDTADPVHAPAMELARAAAAACNLRFGSVDMLLTPAGPSVLEINGGVMVEYLSRTHPRGEEIAFDIYRQAFDRMFDSSADG